MTKQPSVDRFSGTASNKYQQELLSRSTVGKSFIKQHGNNDYLANSSIINTGRHPGLGACTAEEGKAKQKLRDLKSYSVKVRHQPAVAADSPFKTIMPEHFQKDHHFVVQQPNAAAQNSQKASTNRGGSHQYASLPG